MFLLDIDTQDFFCVFISTEYVWVLLEGPRPQAATQDLFCRIVLHLIAFQIVGMLRRASSTLAARLRADVPARSWPRLLSSGQQPGEREADAAGASGEADDGFDQAPRPDLSPLLHATSARRRVVHALKFTIKFYLCFAFHILACATLSHTGLPSTACCAWTTPARPPRRVLPRPARLRIPPRFRPPP